MKAMRSLLILLLVVTGCDRSRQDLLQGGTIAAEDCATAYLSDNMYFQDTDGLNVAVRVVYFSNSRDSSQTLDLSVADNRVRAASTRYEKAGISFTLVGVVNVHGRPADNFPEMARTLRKFERFELQNYFLYGDLYDEPNVLSVYVYDEPGHTEFAGVAGGIGSTFLAMRLDYFLSDMRTFEHEIGHCLGLFHTHQPDTTAGNTAVSGDFVCDTPASESLLGTVDRECNYIGKLEIDPIEIELLKRNLMSYSYPTCREEFTEGQIKRMRWVIAQSRDLRGALMNRAELLTADE
jgi:hypothetical protein